MHSVWKLFKKSHLAQLLENEIPIRKSVNECTYQFGMKIQMRHFWWLSNTVLNRHVKQAEYKEDERIFERIHYTLHMYMSKKYEYMHQHQPRFCEKKFLIKVVRKNQVQEESWEDEVIIISVRVDMKNMQSWKIFAYRNHPFSFTRNGWWCHLLE